MSADPSLINASAGAMHLSPTLEINELVLATRAQGKRVVHLGFGEATFPIQRDVLAIHQEQSQLTSYMPVAGIHSLREVRPIPNVHFTYRHVC
jgi:aspartate/methionine/tyrosine aminotransferase